MTNLAGKRFIGIRAALLAACLAARSGVARADTLVVCTEAAPDFLSAQLSTNQLRCLRAGVRSAGGDRAGWVGGTPALANSWTVSPDGLRYEFKLRHGVKCQSTARFTPTRDFDADDVVFSFRRMFDATSPFYKSTNGNFPEFVDLLAPDLASVTKVSDDTVAFR